MAAGIALELHKVRGSNLSLRADREEAITCGPLEVTGLQLPLSLTIGHAGCG